MAEEIDALQTLNISLDLFIAFGLITVGIALELLLRLVRRWAISKNKPYLTTIINAFTWQPVIWALIIGIGWPLSNLMNRFNLQEDNQELVFTLFAISVAVVTLRLLRGWMRILTETSPIASVSLLNYLLTGFGIVAIALIVAGYILNIPFQTLIFWLFLGIVGLLLAFRDPLNNTLSGLFLTLSQRLEVGDFVRLPSGSEGQVVDIQWDVTTVRQINDVLTVVPNIVISNAEIINYGRPEPAFRATIDIGVSYDSDLQQVEKITLDVVQEVLQAYAADGSTETKPFVRYTGFDASNITYRLYIPASRLDEQVLLKHEVVKRLHQRYGEEGVVISYPRVTINHDPKESDYSEQQPTTSNPLAVSTEINSKQ